MGGGVKGLFLAIQFLTVIPVSLRGTVTERDVARSAAFFPVAGAVQGAIAAAATLLFARIFPSPVVSGLALLALVLVNGGFHLDALADTFDALAVKSAGEGADRTRRLAVMKDSATGAIGVTAIVMALLLKYVFIAAVFDRLGACATAYILFLMAVFSRWSFTPVLFHGKSARPDGLGRTFIDGLDGRSYALSWVLLAALALAAALFWPAFSQAARLGLLPVACVCLYAFSILWVFFCQRKFGGLTGDTAGASAEIADLLFLAIALLWFSQGDALR